MPITTKITKNLQISLTFGCQIEPMEAAKKLFHFPWFYNLPLPPRINRLLLTGNNDFKLFLFSFLLEKSVRTCLELVHN